MKAPLCFPILKPMYRLDINMLLSSESLPIYVLCVYIDLKLIFQIKLSIPSDFILFKG